MIAKDLDIRLTVNKLIENRDSIGATTQKWASMPSIWAKRDILKGGEDLVGNQNYLNAEESFTIRYSSDASTITTKDRLTFKSKSYEILNIMEEPAGKPEFIEIIARRRFEN